MTSKKPAGAKSRTAPAARTAKPSAKPAKPAPRSAPRPAPKGATKSAPKPAPKPESKPALKPKPVAREKQPAPVAAKNAGAAAPKGKGAPAPAKERAAGAAAGARKPAPAASAAPRKGRSAKELLAAESPDAVASAVSKLAPDSDGYVVMNGRRLRIMSQATKPIPSRRPRFRPAAAAEAAPEADAGKPVRTKLNKRELDRYRELLLTERSQLVGDLAAMEDQALRSSGGNLSHMPIHMADLGTDTFDQDFMLGLAENERRRLREIDEALQRIQNGTYGVCVMTGKPIPKARLEAKPWARYTIEAAREIERGQTE